MTIFKAIAILSLGLALSGCTVFKAKQLVGFYEYDGKVYDVYLADELSTGGDSIGTSFVIVNKGDDATGTHINPVAKCASKTLADCTKEFGKELQRQADLIANEENKDEGGMY